MGEHVQIRDLEHLNGDTDRPRIAVAVEIRDRPGPAYKAGVYTDDTVWVQVRGGLLVAHARVRASWRGEYAMIAEVRRRAGAVPLPDEFWAGRPRAGYAVVAHLDEERWIEPTWAGPRSYSYEWIVLEDETKRSAWLDPKAPPRTGEALREAFLTAREASFPHAG